MEKLYVLDTSTLLYSFTALRSFGSKDVVIPYVVLEELDTFKTRDDVVGTNARQVTRELNQLRKIGPINKGVGVTTKGGKLRVELNFQEPESIYIDTTKNDDRILNVCLGLQKEGQNVVLVTKDINLAVRADVLGIEAQDFDTDKTVSSIDDMYTGATNIIVPGALIDSFYAGEDILAWEVSDSLYPNQYLTLVSDIDPAKTALVRVDGNNLPLVKLRVPKLVWGIQPRNREQRFAIDALLNPDISLLTLTGGAGTGKTACSLACALQLVQEDGMYNRLVVSRPIQPMGKDIGYLPGPQPLDAKTLTPGGWTTMGELKEGDEVISRDGKPTKVLGIYPKGKKTVYKVKTNEGQETECCEDHLWRVFSSMDIFYKKEGKLKTTGELKSILDSEGKIDLSLPRNEVVSFVDTILPIPPYLLGAFLGDGSLGKKIKFSNIDKEILERVTLELSTLGCSLNKVDKINYNVVRGEGCISKNRLPVSLMSVETGEETLFTSYEEAASELCVNKSTMKSRCRRQSIISGTKFTFLSKPSEYKSPIKEKLSALGLLNTKAPTKFIPNIYKYTSIENRLNILRGLMDTDGSVKSDGYACFYTSSKRLAHDVIEIVRSLGGRSSLRYTDRIGRVSFVLKKQKATCRQIEYSCTISLPEEFNPFFLQRKKERYKQSYMGRTYIKAIESVGKKEVQCIRVENPEHLYITDDYIVTHNTADEKMSVWMGPIKDTLEFLTRDKSTKGRDIYEEMVAMKMLQVEALTYIRGRSLPNTIMILDEAQSLTRAEIKTVVSRMGDNSKLILIGDVMQIDNPYLDATNNGLSNVIEKFKDYEFSAHVTLVRGERSRLATVASEIL